MKEFEKSWKYSIVSVVFIRVLRDLRGEYLGF